MSHNLNILALVIIKKYLYRRQNFENRKKMATEEQINLSNFLKYVHSNLRKNTKLKGADAAWTEHLKNLDKLKIYSNSMKILSTEFWNKKHYDTKECRINWIKEFCNEYFIKNSMIISREKEMEINNRIFQEDLIDRQIDITKVNRIKLLDVGSCYNPFKEFPIFNSIGIDIAPANNFVYKCDFLNINIVESDLLEPNTDNRLINFSYNSYDVVVFSLVLEYIPTSKQRLKMCRNAYDVLKHEGILIVITPDSKHVGANAKLMKNWQYALSLMGFLRIKFEKLSHITCMVFRKSLSPRIPQRWADLHKKDYMTNEINIPQDFNKSEENFPENEIEEIELLKKLDYIK